MKHTFLASLLTFTLASSQETTPALDTSDNVAGVAYGATLAAGPGSTMGSIVGTSSPDGNGVVFAVNFSGFPITNETAYTYHIHAKPVASDGNCSSTGAHLDPYHAGATSASPSTYKCNSSEPTLCEVGDLAGKHGRINSTVNGGLFSTNYVDLFLSTTPGTAAFFGNLSLVVHRASDNARLNCGNFTLVAGNSTIPASNNSTAMPSSNSSMTLSTTGMPSTMTVTQTQASVTANPTSENGQPTSPIATGGASRLLNQGSVFSAGVVFLVIAGLA